MEGEGEKHQWQPHSQVQTGSLNSCICFQIFFFPSPFPNDFVWGMSMVLKFTIRRKIQTWTGEPGLSRHRWWVGGFVCQHLGGKGFGAGTRDSGTLPSSTQVIVAQPWNMDDTENAAEPQNDWAVPVTGLFCCQIHSPSFSALVCITEENAFPKLWVDPGHFQKWEALGDPQEDSGREKPGYFSPGISLSGGSHLSSSSILTAPPSNLPAPARQPCYPSSCFRAWLLGSSHPASMAPQQPPPLGVAVSCLTLCPGLSHCPTSDFSSSPNSQVISILFKLPSV